MDATANGSRTWAPNSRFMPEIFSQDKTNKDDGKKSSEEDEEDIEVINSNANEKTKEISEHKKGKLVYGDSGKDSAKKSTASKKLPKHIDSVMEMIEDRNKNPIISSRIISTSSSSCTIAKAMSYLEEEIPEVTVCDELYMLGTRLFIKVENREMF